MVHDIHPVTRETAPPPPTLDPIVRLAVFKLVKERVCEAYGQARAQTCATMAAGDRRTAHLAAGRLGTVTKTSGRRQFQITDMTSYSAWVTQRHPHHVITSVDDIFTARLRTAALAHTLPGEPVVDVATGEIVPGVAVVDGSGYLSVRLADNAQDLVAAHWHELSPAIAATIGPSGTVTARPVQAQWQKAA